MREPGYKRMFILRANLVALVLGLIGLSLHCATERAGSGEGKMTEQSTHTFPKESVECLPGDYLISRTKDGRWKVFQVNDLVMLSRLVPLKFKHGTELMEEKNAMDSANPAYRGEVHLLLTAFQGEFVTSDEAIESIKHGTLGAGTPNICLNIENFRKESSLVYQGERNRS
jgi:hypothetical protein